MGCNTSKDSVPQNESENKENQDTGEAGENRGPENKTEGDENILNENSDTKSVSARTITLRSNGTAKSLEEPEGGDNNKVPEVREAAHPKTPSESSADPDQAATKIQAVFRGHKTRQSMKQPANSMASQPEPEPTQEQLNEEFRLDDPELCNAATKIQASFRGHLTRKQEAGKKNESSSSQDPKKHDAKKDEEEELDIDLEDPDLNKAAVKIQASFRGHMVRKENETSAN